MFFVPLINNKKTLVLLQRTWGNAVHLCSGHPLSPGAPRRPLQVPRVYPPTAATPPQSTSTLICGLQEPDDGGASLLPSAMARKTDIPSSYYARMALWFAGTCS
ncbi:unnamed protein product [Pleuronectes platessa]|uniref:Uncharacterized protein n=1 Tax=Pleuronectes platessa TaxID=8262 RepID=A0A9N7YU51_PLEPL|nr:unnamed protein product [Pleuronectes platessa]